ncbi:ATP synthase [Gautieria morchelliformis]|nr:ATP synthase [Gautieria morchelliformis]
MASRIATSSLRGSSSLFRPYAGASLTRYITSQTERASEILEKVPSSPSLITKTGTVVLGTGVIATAISQELYVINEESVLALGTFIILGYIIKMIRTPYKEWADGQIQRIRSILEASRLEHTQAVKDRIGSVGQLKDVVDITKGLFALSKETAQLEAESFALRQQVTLSSELKAVLDSWVRFEQQVKESEQADLAKSVIDKVLKDIQDEKTQREILANAVAEVEQLVKAKAI